MKTLPVLSLAITLDVEPYDLRQFLRAQFPKAAPGKGGRWQVTPAMAMAAWWYFRGQYINGGQA